MEDSQLMNHVTPSKTNIRVRAVSREWLSITLAKRISVAATPKKASPVTIGML
jgi:hypothetical protein